CVQTAQAGYYFDYW
nr:immunoglobulin heavy chain junction region [Mus musculus]